MAKEILIIGLYGLDLEPLREGYSRRDDRLPYRKFISYIRLERDIYAPNALK